MVNSFHFEIQGKKAPSLSLLYRVTSLLSVLKGVVNKTCGCVYPTTHNTKGSIIIVFNKNYLLKYHSKDELCQLDKIY